MRLGWCRTSSPAHRRHSEPYSSPIKLPALSPRSFYAAGQMKTPPSPHCHENNGAKEPRDDDVVTAVKKCDFRLALNDESAVDKRSDGTTTTSNLFEKSSGTRYILPPFLTTVALCSDLLCCVWGGSIGQLWILSLFLSFISCRTQNNVETTNQWANSSH